MVTLDSGKTDYNCYSGSGSQSYGNKGVTIWGPRATDIYLAPGGGEWTGHFTCTKPKCFKTATTVCNLTYKVHTATTSLNNDVGPIVQTFSSDQVINDVPTHLSGSYEFHHSRIGEHDFTATHDIWQARDPMPNGPNILNENGESTIYFRNDDPTVGVYLQGLQIVREYDMKSLGDSCSPGSSPSGDNDLATRVDYPCNYETCGGMSTTAYNPADNVGPILRYGYLYSWTWSNPPATFNGYNTYDEKAHCNFNLNNVALCDTNGNVYDIDTQSNFQRAATNDVPFLLSLDNQNWATYYHGKSNYHYAHGVDLATDPVLSQYYNDGPNASNTLYIKLLTDPGNGLSLKLIDGGGLVNLYRTYKTKPCCPTITSGPVGSGTISPWGGPFPVPQGGKTFDMSASNGYHLSDVEIDGTSKGSTDPYNVQWSDLDLANLGMEGHEILAHFEADHSNHSDHSDGYYTDGGHVDCGSGVATVILNVSGVMVTPPSVTFVVDSSNYSPDSVVCLTPGEHDFSVDSTTSDVYGNYTFAYFDVLDGGANHLYYVYDNPATIEVGSNFIVATYTMDQ